MPTKQQVLIGILADALSDFLQAVDVAYLAWERQDWAVISEAQGNALAARRYALERVRQPGIVQALVPPGGVSRESFARDIADLVQAIWHALRFVHCVAPPPADDDPELQRLLGDVPELREKLRRQFVSLRDSQDIVGKVKGDGEPQANNPPQRRGRSKAEAAAPKNSDKYAVLVAALTKHHKYADGGCLSLEPIKARGLADAANVSPATASRFFHDKFHGHANYKTACRSGRIADCLKLLNGDISPEILIGRGDGQRERE